MLAQWSQLSPLLARRSIVWIKQHKAALTAVFTCALIVACAAVWQAHASAQVSLFSVSLHPPQALEVERALTLWNEAFSGNPQHSEIFVPAARRRDVLLRLTLAGLPHGYVPTSNDVLQDASGLLYSPAVMDDRRRAGIAGDLVAGLRRIDGVVDATVVIAPATNNPFDDNPAHAEASASVQLLLQPGAQMSAAQVAGIARFVAAGYPALTPERVTIVDGSGKLQAARNAAETGVPRELRLQSSIQSALDAVFGAGASVVRVTVRSLGGASNSQATRVYPHGMLQSESGRESGREKGRTFEKERNVRRYAYDTIVEHHSIPAEANARIAVAVFLDAAKVADVPAQSVGDLVRAAAGADVSRGDQVVVRTLPFSLIAPKANATPYWSNRRWALVFVCIACMLLLAAAIMARVHTRNSNAAHAARAATAVCTALEHELPQTAAYVLRALPSGLREHVLQSCAPEYRARIEWHLNGSGHG